MSMTNINKATGSEIFINLHTDYYTSYNPKTGQKQASC